MEPPTPAAIESVKALLKRVRRLNYRRILHDEIARLRVVATHGHRATFRYSPLARPPPRTNLFPSAMPND